MRSLCTNHCTRPSAQDRRRAFTLLELTVSSLISSILMAGLGSTIYIATRAGDPDVGSLRDCQESSAAAFDMTAELQFAQSFTERTATSVVFTVADRTGDAKPETIRYAWSGTPGDPLIRQFNGGAIVKVVENVQELSLTYSVKSIAEPTPPPSASDEKLFLQQDSTNSGTASLLGINENRFAEYFKPTLPADAISWRITRVKFIANIHKNAGGIFSVEVRPANGTGEPDSNEVDAVVVYEADLIDYAWHEVAFPNAGGLSPSDGYFIAFVPRSSGTVALLTVGTNSVGSPETKYFVDDGSGTWVEDATKDIWLEIWGTITSPTPPPPDRYFLQSIGLTLQVGTDTKARMQTRTDVLNRPEVSNP